MRGLSSAQSAGKHSPVSMTVSDMRVCTAGKRSSSVKANLGLEDSGVAGDGSREQTPWEDTSDLRLEGFASSHF